MTLHLRTHAITLMAATLMTGCTELASRDAHEPNQICPRGYGFEIDHPQKIGIGAWEIGSDGTAIERIRSLGIAWYHNWTPAPLTGSQMGGSPEFVPMIWGLPPDGDLDIEIAAIRESYAEALLAFNEPDVEAQSSLSVETALGFWRRLAKTGKRLGSPAPSQAGALGNGRWLPRFAAAARAAGIPPDFIAVHYYAGTPDVEQLLRFLERVRETYRKPIWVTEWGLVHPETWRDGRARYSMDEAACFFRSGAALMDDLPYVERHAWFAAFDGGDGWRLNTHSIEESGELTLVGRAIREGTASDRRR